MKQPNTPIAQRLWEYGAILALLIFFPGIWVLLALDARSEDKAHHAFLAQLNGLSTVFELELNGKRIDDPSRLVSDLKQVQRYRGHHAPGRKPKWYRIDITDEQRTLRFLLARPETQPIDTGYFSPVGIRRILKELASERELAVLSTRNWRQFSSTTNDTSRARKLLN